LLSESVCRAARDPRCRLFSPLVQSLQPAGRRCGAGDDVAASPPGAGRLPFPSAAVRAGQPILPPVSLPFSLDQMPPGVWPASCALASAATARPSVFLFQSSSILTRSILLRDGPSYCPLTAPPRAQDHPPGNITSPGPACDPGPGRDATTQPVRVSSIVNAERPAASLALQRLPGPLPSKTSSISVRLLPVRVCLCEQAPRDQPHTPHTRVAHY